MACVLFPAVVVEVVVVVYVTVQVCVCVCLNWVDRDSVVARLFVSGHC